jgi:hypothetical protein
MNTRCLDEYKRISALLLSDTDEKPLKVDMEMYELAKLLMKTVKK